MELFALSTVVFLAVLSWFHFLRSESRHRNAKLPPGPYPFPIIGNILQLGQNPHQALAKLSKTYGPLMSLHLGRIYTVIVSSPEITREILQTYDQAFSSRIIPAAVEAHDHHKTSMAFLPVGNQWRKLRKLSKEQMFSTHRLEASKGLRQEKLQKLCEHLQKCCDASRVVNIGEAVFVTTFNLTTTTIFSTEFTTFDSDATQDFLKTFESLSNVSGVPNFADYFPILKPFDPQGIKRKSTFYFGKLLGFIEDLINQRLESRSKVCPKKTDLLETLPDLREGNVVGGRIRDNMSTSSTVEWAMTELLLNPLIKAKHELSTVMGDKQQLNESDISQLPYLQAVIKETFRCHPVAPLLVPRKSDYDVQVSGYAIPKGTQILINVWAMGREASIWSNPECFEPQRFLDNNIDFKGRDFELIPFGAGRRICLGLPLADRMLHIMVATLIHNFDWKLEAAEREEDHQGELFGLALRKAVPLRATPMKPSL